MKSFLKLALFFSFLVCQSVFAADIDKTALINFIKNTREFSAQFTQSLFDEHGSELQFSAGKFSLKKPGKFSWDYEEPYVQKIISNGKLVWMYDSELEQVTVREIDESLTQTSMVLLFDYQDLDKSFDIVDQGVGQGVIQADDQGAAKSNNVHWFELVSKTTNSEFNKIFIGLTISGKTAQLSQLKLIDGFDQTTLITFTHLNTHPELADASFDFVVPKGVDVIGN